MAELTENYKPFPGGVGVGKKAQEIREKIEAAGELATLDRYWKALEVYPNLTTFERYLLKGFINKQRETLQEKQNGATKTGPHA